MLPEAGGTEPPGLLVVDDDPLFLRTFAANLAAEGYLPHCFTDPQAALSVVLDGSLTLAACVMDLDMPGLDGLAFLRAMSVAGRTLPMILVTAHSEHVYEEEALRLGAADFVDKSRGPGIILRRIALVLRGRPEVASQPVAADLSAGQLLLRPSARRADWNDAEVPLSRTEFDVLLLLVGRIGQSVSYREIYDTIKGAGFVAGPGEEGYRANVRATIKRIRKKFADLDPEFAALGNLPGYGYAWRADA
jgi:two-component system response regulator ChvI